MKIQMGLFYKGQLVEPILNAIDASCASIATMNALAGLLDGHYQDIKHRDGVTDESYIAFDYIK